MNPQAKVLFASFIYFSIIMEKNDMLDNIPPNIKKVFKNLSDITKMYSHHYRDITDELNVILKDIDKDVDYMLLSVSIIAEYYEQMRGRRRYFTPMKWDEIVKLQEECLELSDKDAVDTFDVAELIVERLLK